MLCFEFLSLLESCELLTKCKYLKIYSNFTLLMIDDTPGV